MTSVDWSKPIETVPCERNPAPVPCEFAGVDDYGDANVSILGVWLDHDGLNEGRAGMHGPYAWAVFDHGQFHALEGSVRNVPEQSA